MLADTGELRSLIAGAGFREVIIETVVNTVEFPSAEDYVRIQLAATPLATVIAACDAARRDELVSALVEDVSAPLARYESEKGLEFPQEVHVAVARRAGNCSSLGSPTPDVGIAS